MAQAHADHQVIDWLTHQLAELDQWRSELMSGSDQASLSAIDRIDQHRNWLEGALSSLDQKDPIPG